MPAHSSSPWYFVSIAVRLRDEVHDPHAELIARTIQTTSHFSSPPHIQQFRTGKTFSFQLQASTPQDAEAQAHQIADKLLHNPQIETYRLNISLQATASPNPNPEPCPT